MEDAEGTERSRMLTRRRGGRGGNGEEQDAHAETRRGRRGAGCSRGGRGECQSCLQRKIRKGCKFIDTTLVSGSSYVIAQLSVVAAGFSLRNISQHKEEITSGSYGCQFPSTLDFRNSLPSIRL
ncbi:hypothetical protein KKE26_12240 [bacterium]|nr:hypothetical protein [bacterium]MBU1753816.1 hypothetical protein [bacterium]